MFFIINFFFSIDLFLNEEKIDTIFSFCCFRIISQWNVTPYINRESAVKPASFVCILLYILLHSIFCALSLFPLCTLNTVHCQQRHWTDKIEKEKNKSVKYQNRNWMEWLIQCEYIASFEHRLKSVKKKNGKHGHTHGYRVNHDVMTTPTNKN